MVDREKLWTLLEEKGIKGKFLTLLKSMYEKSQIWVDINGSRTQEPVRPERGLKQGCVLSPILFSLYMNDLGRILQETKLGIRCTYPPGEAACGKPPCDTSRKRIEEATNTTRRTTTAMTTHWTEIEGLGEIVPTDRTVRGSIYEKRPRNTSSGHHGPAQVPDHVKFEWTWECQKAFEELKKWLSSRTVLVPYKPNLETLSFGQRVGVNLMTRESGY